MRYFQSQDTQVFVKSAFEFQASERAGGKLEE